ncbi:MAG TPA: hypothetical protein VLT45_14500, partial [Kofleriaceae bacterium]|nr:hypothetical protein [Kofleriaceae bacterium]
PVDADEVGSAAIVIDTPREKPEKPEKPERPPHEPVERPHRPPPPPTNSNEAAALYKQGVQQLVKGDAKAALTSLQKAKSANPSYAPTWRVLGQVYRKLGDKGSAKNAFLRYLTLAPNASDAATVREQLGQL